jgi:hypothetical protein
MLRYKIYKYPPPYGPFTEQFTYGPKVYREGFIVEFYPEKSDKWIGNFQELIFTAYYMIKYTCKANISIVVLLEFLKLI